MSGMVNTNVVDDNRLSPILIISLDYLFSCYKIIFLFLSFFNFALKVNKIIFNQQQFEDYLTQINTMILLTLLCSWIRWRKLENSTDISAVSVHRDSVQKVQHPLRHIARCSDCVAKLQHFPLITKRLPKFLQNSPKI